MPALQRRAIPGRQGRHSLPVLQFGDLFIKQTFLRGSVLQCDLIFRNCLTYRTKCLHRYTQLFFRWLHPSHRRPALDKDRTPRCFAKIPEFHDLDTPQDNTDRMVVPDQMLSGIFSFLISFGATRVGRCWYPRSANSLPTSSISELNVSRGAVERRSVRSVLTRE